MGILMIVFPVCGLNASFEIIPTWKPRNIQPGKSAFAGSVRGQSRDFVTLG
jgi:hypothetical protein